MNNIYIKLKILNLLYIEDDEKIGKSYLESFKLFFNNIFIAKNYDDALYLYNTKKTDIILVDIELKNSLNGIDIVKEIRKKDVKTPIVFLTSYGDNNHLLEAINLQIDGYIIKPLILQDFKNIMIKCLEKLDLKKDIYLDDEIYYSLETKELFKKNNTIIPLGKKENLLLQLFLKYPNKTFTKDEIEENIWGSETVSDSAIKNLIMNLRKKIGKDKIINISKIGWKIDINY